MSAALRPVLETLTRQRGVRASLIVSERDGLVIDSSLRFGQDGERVAAFAASIYRKARLSAKAARLGAVTFLQLDAERGRICAWGAGNDLVIVTRGRPGGERGADPGGTVQGAGDDRMKIAAVEPWIEAPLKRYVDDARARLALLLHPSGQVMAQAGFTREVDVMTACALARRSTRRRASWAARSRAAPSAGFITRGRRSRFISRRWKRRAAPYICFTVFDDETSLGLVRIYFEELRRDLAAAAPRRRRFRCGRARTSRPSSTAICPPSSPRDR